jgi:hypothetical protein
MAQKQQPKTNPEAPFKLSKDAEDLIEQLASLGTRGDIYKFGISAGFKAAYTALTPGEQVLVQETYTNRYNYVQNRKKLEEIDGKVVEIVSVRTGFSEKYGNDFVVLSGSLEGEKFEIITSATIVSRHFMNPVNIKRLPAKYVFGLSQRENGHTMWEVSRLGNDADNSALPW